MPSKGFTFTGGWQDWQIPSGITSVEVTLNGAGSGGVRGGKVVGTLAVTPLRRLWILCGDAGKANAGDAPGVATTGGGGGGGRGKNGGGGDSGGGASILKIDSTSGATKAVAGGAGGRSGDDGKGGQGGSGTGGTGTLGTLGSKGKVTGGHGGTQTLGGAGGTSSAGANFNGAQTLFPTKPLQAGGTGGYPRTNNTVGGGGGGGGWRPGGGGAGGSKNADIPGSGGGGGANYTGGLTQATSERGTGSAAAGVVTLRWGDPPPENVAPSPPTDVKIGLTYDTLKDAEDEMTTRSTGTVIIDAEMNDSNPEDVIRLLVRLTTVSNFATYLDLYTPYVGNASRANVMLTGLAQDTHYYVRLYGQDGRGLTSEDFNSVDFWTNRGPTTPDLFTPPENANMPANAAVGFTWSFEDEDTGDKQSAWQLQYRTAPGLSGGAGPWTVVGGAGEVLAWQAPPLTFKGSTWYEWQVRNADLQGYWGDWSFTKSFYAIGQTNQPVPLGPINDIALDVGGDTTFYWRFVDYDPGDFQRRADIRWRLVGQDDSAWITRFGGPDPTVPGTHQNWTLPPDTFQPGYHYEWEVRTYDSSGGFSDWSAAATFWSIVTPGSLITTKPVVANPQIAGSLGCGSYRVFVYDQGGKVPRGEIEPITSLSFSRVRDDISTCLIHTNGFGEDCCQMFEQLSSWAHELVVFRDGVRVWEGPITRIGFEVDSVEIEAKDVLAYLYRRIMRQGYNDSFQMVDPITREPVFKDGVQIGLSSVVERAMRITINALAPWDPNVLPYLTAIHSHDDARQSRVVEDYSQTAWEQVDDLAATAGLDYTVVGRRVIYWDTHRPIGRLPEMRDKDFNNPPVVTEYGMQMANYSAVTNGQGIWGAARPLGEAVPYQYYGPVEMLASAYGETAAAADEVLTPTARQALVSQLEDQAQRNIAHRWPTPVVVRVPDNSTLNPQIGVTFDQLVPGVWIPLRSTGTCRKVAQWQKLDSVNVQFGSDGESVQVVMSPAPNAGADPDADEALAED